MHFSIVLIYTLTLLGVGPSRAFGKPLARCQHLLTEAKERLAQGERGLFERWRPIAPGMTHVTRGLLLAIYDVSLDGERMNLTEGFSHVPTAQQTALKYIQQAADEGLIEFTKSPRDGRLRLLGPGPRLTDLIRTEIEAQLHQMIEGSNVGAPPDVRSAALDRLIVRKMWHDYHQTWQTHATVDDLHLRYSYGLLVHLYELGLRGRRLNKRAAGKFIPNDYQPGRIKILDTAVRRGLIDVEGLSDGDHRRYLRITPRATELVEGRIDAGIDRANAILLKAAHERTRAVR